MFKKRRFKPVNKKMVSLSLAVIMLMSVPGKSILSYAMTGQEENAQKQNVQEQSVESESGYRLYADELTSDSGAVKGDITEVLPEYEIINVKLPDGSLAAPEEVNFPVTESGEYVFEVIYNSASNDADPAKTTEAQITAIQSEDAQSAEEQSVEEQSASDSLPELAGDTESEELTLTVTLPEAETEKAAEPVQEETQGGESEPQEAVVASSTAAFARSAASSISTRAGVFGDENGWSTSNKTWSASDFSTAYSYGSSGHMDFSADPGGTIFELPAAKSFEAGKGVKFTFGAQLGTESYGANWLQQGAAFSEITFDFTKDFALEGYMRIGDEFGCPSTESPISTDMQIDGGVTISFIPTNEMSTAKANAALMKGAAYRLGAYGTLPNSIVCEFDTSTDDYYSPDPAGQGRNFTISEADIQKTGDYQYASGTGVNAFPALNDKYIWQSARDTGEQIQNATHIGISTTSSDGYVSNSTNTTKRVVLGSSDTGIIPYRIYYNSSTKVLTFKVQEAHNDTDIRTVSYNLTSYFLRQPNKNLTLAFTYGAGYQNIENFIKLGDNNPYFTGSRTGQIDIWAKEMYAIPNLQTGQTKVRWLESGTSTAADSSNNDAYYTGSGYNYGNRALWPVAGDRIYAQNNFTPRTSLDPANIASGTLTLEVNNLSIKDKGGQPITSLAPPTPTLYYKVGNNGAWKQYTKGERITVNGREVVYARVEMKLPELSDNSTEQYDITGNIKGIFTVGNSKVTHTLDLMTENSKKITVSRNPMYIGFNGQDYYNSVRVIKSTEGITQLKNISNGGSKDAVNSGDKTSLHYGSGYRPMSTGTSTASGDYYPMYQDRSGNGSGTYDLKKVDLQSASMDNLSAVTTQTNIVLNKTYDVDKSKDTRYILTYLIEDGTYSNKSSALTQNTNRGKSTGKRVMWTSNNVTVESGYEFYMKPSVTMTAEDFTDFNNVQDKASYYQKIADAAEAIVFKTSSFDWNNLVGSSGTISGTGTHTGIEQALANPGRPYDVTIRYRGTDNQVIEKNVKLTIADPTPKVVSVSDSTIKNETAEKIIFNKEDYTVSATFKLVNGNGSDIAYSDIDWADSQDTLASGLITDKPFTGQANFKFTRRAIPQ